MQVNMACPTINLDQIKDTDLQICISTLNIHMKLDCQSIYSGFKSSFGASDMFQPKVSRMDV